MNFREIRIEDKDTIINYLDGENRKLCEFCFTDIFIWKDLYNTEFCIDSGILYIRQRIEGSNSYYFYPPMPTKSRLLEGIENIIIDATKGDYEFCVGGVSLESLARVASHFPRVFNAKCNRDYADYIYLATDLINLSGRKFHKKKNLVNKFKKEFKDRWEFKKITLENLEELIEFNKKWIKASIDRGLEDLLEEQIAINIAFNNYDLLDLDGGMLLVDGDIVAYTFGNKVREDMYVVQVEKALSEYVGAYQMINNEFAKAYCEGIKYINREDDVGLEGLRKAKMSYNPVIIEDYYEMKLKKKIDAVKIVHYKEDLCGYDKIC